MLILIAFQLLLSGSQGDRTPVIPSNKAIAPQLFHSKSAIALSSFCIYPTSRGGFSKGVAFLTDMSIERAPT
jgi:hypothetical protein